MGRRAVIFAVLGGSAATAPVTPAGIIIPVALPDTSFFPAPGIIDEHRGRKTHNQRGENEGDSGKWTRRAKGWGINTKGF